MNFDKESKSEEFFFFLGGGGGGGVRGWGGWRRGNPTEKKRKHKNNRYSLIFCAHALNKILSSWLKWFSSFNTNKRSNEQVRGITLPLFYRNQSKVILDPKQSSEFQDPSSSNSLHIVLTRFSYFYKS